MWHKILCVDSKHLCSVLMLGNIQYEQVAAVNEKQELKGQRIAVQSLYCCYVYY